jgi:hypothetical protein
MVMAQGCPLFLWRASPDNLFKSSTVDEHWSLDLQWMIHLVNAKLMCALHWTWVYIFLFCCYPGCDDNDNLCEDWAASGECIRNAAFMVNYTDSWYVFNDQQRWMAISSHPWLMETVSSNHSMRRWETEHGQGNVSRVATDVIYWKILAQKDREHIDLLETQVTYFERTDLCLWGVELKLEKLCAFVMIARRRLVITNPHLSVSTSKSQSKTSDVFCRCCYVLSTTTVLVPHACECAEKYLLGPTYRPSPQNQQQVCDVECKKPILGEN